MNISSRAYMPITKSNLLAHYHTARENAFRKTTIAAAFRKTGIHPLNPNCIDQAFFEPAKNTTTQAAPILPVRLPNLLLPILETPTAPLVDDEPSTSKPATMLQTTPVIANQYLLVGLPPQLPPSASRNALEAQIEQLRAIANAACVQIQRDYTQMVLMDSENERLRQRAFAKQQKAKKTNVKTTAHPRHMTSDEILTSLAMADWRTAIKKVHAEAVPAFTARRKIINDIVQQTVAANKAQKKDDKARERLEKRDAVAAAKLAARLEKERLRAVKKPGTQRKAAAKKAGKGKAAGRGRKVVEDTETDGEEFSSVDSSGYSNATDTSPPAALAAQLPRFPRPKPRPVTRLAAPTNANAIAGMTDKPVSNPNPPAAKPHPIQQAALIVSNNEAADAPTASGSSLTVPAAKSSIPTQGLRRSARNARQE